MRKWGRKKQDNLPKNRSLKKPKFGLPNFWKIHLPRLKTWNQTETIQIKIGKISPSFKKRGSLSRYWRALSALRLMWCRPKKERVGLPGVLPAPGSLYNDDHDAPLKNKIIVTLSNPFGV